MSDKDKPSSDVMTHAPLPYVVRLRATLSDDAEPVTREYRGLAYSALEAALQAIFEAGGTGLVDDARYRIEHIGPDEQQWVETIVRQAVAVAERRSK